MAYTTLTDHFDKWLYLLRHLPDLEDPPVPLQENVFLQLFETAALAKFSPEEIRAYENSLKYYRDMHGVIETARHEGIQEGREQGIQEGREQGIQEGREQGIQEGREQGIQEGQELSLKSLVLKLLTRRFGELSRSLQSQLNQLSLERLEHLSETLLDLQTIADLEAWLEQLK
jgi:flagellar biosynthesis/type III secretory pathway protein FliH